MFCINLGSAILFLTGVWVSNGPPCNSPRSLKSVGRTEKGFFLKKNARFYTYEKLLQTPIYSCEAKNRSRIKQMNLVPGTISSRQEERQVP